MNGLLSYKTLTLLYARDRKAASFPSETGWELGGWRIDGDWHVMTIDTNDDRSSGLDGGIAVDCVGSWSGGTMETEITLDNYGEILFEHYVQNGQADTQGESNRLTFFIDGVKKLEITGPSPWQRSIPIGLTPGRHKIRFDYAVEGSLSAKKGVVDKITVWEGKDAHCIITGYTPPRPVRSLGKNGVLRGFTRFQEMAEADTEIKLTALFDGYEFHEFIIKSDAAFYFVDEFGVCYRGIFPETISPKSIAMNAVYSIELVMVAGQKTGIGFC